MDEFERNLYLYYFNGLNPYPRLEMKFNNSSGYTVQVNKLLHNYFVRNDVSQHKKFKCCLSVKGNPSMQGVSR